jgi:DNA polymerase-3 subunit alpha
MKPSCFEDIIAAISLYRPGPMDSIPRYIAGKTDPSSVKYKTEKLRPILDVTYGCMVYQEQVMQIVRDLAGYSYGRSDLVRRAMAKKKHKVMDEEREIFVHGMKDKDGNIQVPGCVRNGAPESVANEIYDEMISFASYAFNKSHAAAYGVVAMQTAWLKRYYPVQFMAAMLNSVYGNTGKIAGYISYCRGRGIAVLPPDINRSRWKFTVDRDAEGKPAILFGLGAVKSVGENAVNAIRQERERKGLYRDIFDFCRRVDPTECNKRVVESLIKAGAFDRLPATRPQMLAVYEQAMDANQSARKKNVDGQVSLFDMFGGEDDPLLNPRIPLPDLPDAPPRVKLQMEKEAAGVYMSGHPLDEYREILSKMSFTTAELAASEDDEAAGSLDGRFVDLGGILTEVKGKATKKGDFMAFVTLEDMAGQVECLVFPRVYEKYQPLLQEDAAVVVSGKISVREEESPKILVERGSRIEDWERRPGEANISRREPPMNDAQMAAKAERKLFLRLERKDLERAAMLLASETGGIPVYMHIAAEKITLLSPRENWCNGSERCLRKLQDEFGSGNVVLKG